MNAIQTKVTITIIQVLTLIPFIMFALTLFFGNINSFSFIEADRINGIIIQRFDIANYLKSINNTISDFPRLQFELPNVFTSENAVELLKNILNTIIGIFNMATYPLQIGAYYVKLVATFIGIDFNTDISHSWSWLVDFVNRAVNGSYIPYI